MVKPLFKLRFDLLRLDSIGSAFLGLGFAKKFAYSRYFTSELTVSCRLYRAVHSLWKRVVIGRLRSTVVILPCNNFELCLLKLD